MTKSRHFVRSPKKGPLRPKKPLSFVPSSSSSQRGYDSDSPTEQAQNLPHKLRDHIRLIDLIIRRNKNQHRNQLFFKYLTLLRRSLIKLETVLSKLVTLAPSGNASRSAAQIRERFETESRLRSRREVLTEFLQEHLVPKCYLAFSGLVADTQFANLGVVLMALLAGVAAGENGVGLPKHDHMLTGDQPVATTFGVSDDDIHEEYDEMVVTSTKMTGEDQGEIVERIYSASPQPIKFGFEESFEDCNHRSNIAEMNDGSRTTHEANVRTTHDNLESAVHREDIPNSTGKLVTKQKKIRKKKGALDDLFSGLL